MPKPELSGPLSLFLLLVHPQWEIPAVAHMEILIILLNLIFQICLLSIFFGHFIEEFGSVIAFPVQVWS